MLDLGPRVKHPYKNVLICGFMGAGKSWLLKRLKRTGRDSNNYNELDDLILERAGYNTILKMMRELGEEHFRRIENEILVERLKEGGNIISLGGGALNQGINHVINKRDDILVVWITTDLAQCEENLKKDHKNVRPLYKDNKDNIQSIYDDRQKVYEVAQVKISWEELQEIQNYENFTDLLANYLST